MSKSLVLLCVLVGVVCVYAQNICLCPIVSQQTAYNNANVVAKVKINQRIEDKENNQVVYDVTYEQVFKPKGALNDTRQLVTDTQINHCGLPNLFAGQTYLIAGTRKNGKVEITSCGQIPNMLVGRPFGPTLWSIVDAHLLKQLENGQL